ncbi:natural killer cells antigen CD94-like isoform X1 [Aquarana catesbeiana]|uniref:natural killer cells antigen CD94-like isoform X1 n=1 Tax=Aquarana catesbeiana TaxID=8400 RepID=UPI003CC9AD1B
MGTYAEYSLLSLPVGSSHMPLDLPSERRPVDSALLHSRKKQGQSCLHKSIISLAIISILLMLTICILVMKIKHLKDVLNEARIQGNTTQSKQEEWILHHIRKELCTDIPKSNLNGSKYKQTECRLCPTGWHLFQDNCYLIPSSQKCETWNNSRNICIARNSHLLTFEYEEQVIYIENQTENIKNYWIGYHFEMNTEKWVWENCGSCVDIRNNSKEGIPGNNCMVKSEHKYYPENCNSRNGWICQKKALSI